MAKTTLKIYPNEVKRSKLTGKIPLYLRLARHNKKVETRLDWEITSKEFEAWNRKLNMVELETITNDFINSINRKFTMLKFSDSKNINEMSLQEIRDHLQGITHKGNSYKTILQYAIDYYEQNIKNNRGFSEGTKKNYRKSLNHLRTFLQQNGYQSTKITNLNYQLAAAMKSYLLNDDEKTGRKGISEVSASAIVKQYRKIFTEAESEELIKKNPFKLIKLSTKSAEKPRLNISQIQKLYDCDDLELHEQVCLDIFLFMCLTGCAYQDCQDLRYENNLERDKQGTKLTYRRNKTEQESMQYLTQFAVETLVSFGYEEEDSNTGCIVPKISNTHYNRTLKIIALKAGIKIKLSTHIARHTYRQLLDEADITDISVVRKLMGWSNNDNMDAIYRRVTDSRLLKTQTQFNHFLNKKFKSK